MKSRTVVKSYPMLFAGGVFIAGTCFVLFDDVINGAKINTGHVMTALALMAAVIAGHQIVSMARERRFILMFGHLLLAIAASCYVATMSGTRNSEYGAVKTHNVEMRNAERAKADELIKKIDAELDELKKAEKDECKKVGEQCRRKTERRQIKEMFLEDRRRERAALGGDEIPNAGYKKLAEAISILANAEEHQAKVERVIILALPWLAVLIAEFGTIIFSATAFGHQTIPVTVSLPQLKAELPTVSGGGNGGGKRKPKSHFPEETDGKQEAPKVSNVVSFGPRSAVLKALAESEKPALTRTELGNLLGMNAVQVHRACLEVADELVTWKEGKWLLTALRSRVVEDRRAATA